MRIGNILFFSWIVLCGISIGACDGSKWGVAEQNYDSLFLGISLGMDKQAFYDHCWELNRQKIFTNGSKSHEVQYILQNEFEQPVYMQFYPTFYKDKIVEMPVLFSYQGWAPWNKEYASDSLFVNMLSVFKKWYGEEFKVLEHPTMGKVYYKLDGKRRINLFIRDDQFVQAVFTDLKMEREQKESNDKESTTED